METTKSITIDTPIKGIRFPRHDTRIQHSLNYHGVNTVGDLVKLTRYELKKFNNLGMASINSIEDWLESHGVSLGDGNFQSPADSLDLTPQDWEQRRYEVAKAILPKFIDPDASEISNRNNICDAIDLATTFIRILKESSEMEIEEDTWK